MKKALLLVGIGCAWAISTAAPAGKEVFTPYDLEAGGLQRSYLLYAPTRGASPRPLVILLHGNGGSAAQFVGTDGKPAPMREWLRIAKRENLAVAVPDGTTAVLGGARGWNDCRGDTPNNPDTDDVAFLTALIDAVGRRKEIDPQRVFVLGHSNGGHMALRMAMEAPGRIRAIAAVAAAMPSSSECRVPTSAVPILLVNGTADSVMPYSGGRVGFGQVNRGGVISTPASIEFWVRLHAIETAPREQRLPNRDRDDGSTVLVQRYDSAAGRPAVVLYRVDGGGHSIPTLAAPQTKGPLSPRQLNRDFETADVAWRFFAAQL